MYLLKIYICKMIKFLNLLTSLCLYANFQYGSMVYLTQYRSEAKAQIYVTKWKSEADLIVYVSKWKSEVRENDGLWYFTKWKSEGIPIYITTWKSSADLIIYYTTWKSEAGWKDDSKKHFLNP